MKIMFCSKCGGEIGEGSKFCKKCGNPIGVTQVVENSPDPVQDTPPKTPLYIFIFSIILSVVGVAFEEVAPPLSDLFSTVAGLGLVVSPIWYLISCRGKKCGAMAKVMMVFVLILVIGILSAVILASLDTAREQASTSSATSIQEELQLAAKEANVGLPMMVDTETELVRAYATNDNKMNYKYNLVNYSASELDWLELKDVLLPTMETQYCHHPDIEYYRTNSVPMKWHYYDKDDAFIGAIELSNKDCN